MGKSKRENKTLSKCDRKHDSKKNTEVMHAYKGALTVKEEKDDSNSKWKKAYAYLDAPYSSL